MNANNIKHYQKKFNNYKKNFGVVLAVIFGLSMTVDELKNNPISSYIQLEIIQANVSEVDVWCELVRVVDGDTIIVKYDGEDTRVRFIGVDTPESVHVDSSKNTDDGIVASDYMKALLQDVKVVGLEFDEGQYDIYNRLLAYVYLEDGTMLNAHLVETGYAEVKTYQPNTKYESYFKSLVN